MKLLGKGSVVVAQLGKETFHQGRNSNRCCSETEENICLSKAGEGKRKESAMYD